MPRAPASIVATVDQSGSMGTEGKLPAAKTDTCTFINIMQPNDKLAVVGFSDNASVVFPSGSSSVITIVGQATKNSGCNAVLALQALNRTNVKGAVALAQQLLASAPSPRGILLVSDGMWNVGGDPTQGLNTSVPVYTVALGQTFNPGFLQTIATQTGGTYNYAPDAFQLAEVYDDMVAETGVAALVARQANTVPQYNFAVTPVTVTASVNLGCFAVSWLNTAIAYTSGTPSGNQLTVRLIDPSNQPWAQPPVTVGPGYVVFEVPNPAAGTWQVEVWTSAAGGVQATSAGFEPDSTTWLDLTMDARAVVGRPQAFRAAVTTGGQSLAGARASAVLERPLRPLDESLGLNKAGLAAVEPDEAALGDGVPEPLARLAALRASLSPDTEDPHPRIFEPLAPPAFDGEAFVGFVEHIPHQGEYTVRVVVEGTTPSGGAFRRQRRCSFVAG